MPGFAPAGRGSFGVGSEQALLFRQKRLFKKFASKAAGREKAEAYRPYVEAFEQRERCWRGF